MTEEPTITTAPAPPEAFTPSALRPGHADQEPAPIGGLMGVIPQLRFPPAHLRERLADETEAGRRAAKEAGAPVDAAEDVPASEIVLRQQREIRAKALRDCLPLNREDAHRGLACLEGDQHAEELAAWLADPLARTLILAGRTGSGKTQAAYAVAAEACHRGAAMIGRGGAVATRELLVRAWTVNGYLAELRPDGSPDPVWQIRDRARTAELLILDDLGAETDAETTEFIRRELVELLEWRLERRLRTVVTTNLKSMPLQQRFGDRLMSRLVQDATALQFLGPDRRNLRRLEW